MMNDFGLASAFDESMDDATCFSPIDRRRSDVGISTIVVYQLRRLRQTTWRGSRHKELP